MKRFITTAAILASMAGAPMLVGCDRTVEDKQTVQQKPNGETDSQEKKVTQSPNGTMTTTTEKHVDNPNPPNP